MSTSHTVHLPQAEPGTAKSCCQNPSLGQAAPRAADQSPQLRHGGGTSHFRLTTAATLHCLSGCALGEFIGLTIGVALGLSPWTTMALATICGFASGYTLGLLPLVRRGSSWAAAFRTLWLGETISIAVMELAMNFTDYHVGGLRSGSVFSLMFWAGYAAALPAGFLVAWPVNGWLLKRSIKQPCH